MSGAIDSATYDFYQSGAKHHGSDGAITHSRDLDAFLDRLEPGADVLELGCGGGRDSVRILERGFNLDATDGIPAMVETANGTRNVNARLMRFDELNAEHAYDAVWAHACLLHCPRAQLPDIVRAIRRSLRQNGWHFASYKLGDGEGRDLLGRLHNFPDADWLRALYRNAGFEVVAESIFAGKGSDGTMRDWIALIVRNS